MITNFVRFFLLSLFVHTYLGAFYFIFLKVLKSTNVLNYSTKSCTTQNMSNLVSCQVKVSTASKVIKVISSYSGYSPQQNYLLLNHLELPIPLKIWKKKLKTIHFNFITYLQWLKLPKIYTVLKSAYKRNRNNWNYSF